MNPIKPESAEQNGVAVRSSAWLEDADLDGPECGLCGDDGFIMLSDAGPGEWGEDCFCEEDRPIECPECRRHKSSNDPDQRPAD